MYGSDNQAPVHPAVMAAIAAANEGRAGGYGDDPWTRRAEALIRETFETDDLDVLLVGTGGAANGLALSLLAPAWSGIACHVEAHVIADEGSGPELFTGGAPLIPTGRSREKLTAADLEAAARAHPKAFVHGRQIRAATVTNLSENGLAHRPDEIAALSAVCRREGWGLHVDGARFANAVAATGASPAELTWRSGVDALSFGLTKIGAMAAEAVVVFGAARDPAAPYLRKRAGQLFSKHRFLAAQFVAMLEGGLWLDLARHADAAARVLAERLAREGADILAPVDGNEVFARLTPALRTRLGAAGWTFYDWPAHGDDAVRFVTSWNTRDPEP